MKNVDRYLKLVKWARKRYTTDRMLTLYRGNVPTAYTLIEAAAWEKYIA